MFPDNLVLIIAGSTGVGKSDVAAKVCAKHRGMVISADSVQVYRGVQIGANKPTAQEREATPHLLIDVADATQLYNAADWRKDTIACIQTFKINNNDETEKEAVEDASPRLKELEKQIEDLRRRHGYEPKAPILPVVVGGTMMYLQWLVHGRPDAAQPTESAIEKARETIQRYQKNDNNDDDDKEKGWEEAVQYVASLNPVLKTRAEALGENDWYRLRRTMEVGFTVLDQNGNAHDDHSDSIVASLEDMYTGQREGGLESFGYDVRCFFLCPDDRMMHTTIVDRRCEQMIQRGLLKETTDLALNGQLPDMATKAIGYRQVLDYLNRSNHKDKDAEAFEAFLNDFTTATRRYAKRQMQWFRKDDRFAFIPVSIGKKKEERVDEAAAMIEQMCSLSRTEFEEVLLEKTSSGETPLSALTKQKNSAQGKKMKFYRFKRYELEKGSSEFERVLGEADECTNRLQAATTPTEDKRPRLAC